MGSKYTNPDYLAKMRSLRDDGKVKTKVIFLDYADFADVVVESFAFGGKFYMFVARVNQHREEVRWEDLWEFDTAKEANDYFKKHIKDRDGFADYLVCKSNEAYADYMMRAVGTLD